MKKHMLRLWNEEEGQDLTEYALLLVLLSLAAVGASELLPVPSTMRSVPLRQI